MPNRRHDSCRPPDANRVRYRLIVPAQEWELVAPAGEEFVKQPTADLPGFETGLSSRAAATALLA